MWPNSIQALKTQKHDLNIRLAIPGDQGRRDYGYAFSM